MILRGETQAGTGWASLSFTRHSPLATSSLSTRRKRAFLLPTVVSRHSSLVTRHLFSAATRTVVLGCCCSLILSQSEINLHGDIKCIRHLSQEGAPGLHRQESTPSHQVGQSALRTLPFTIRFHYAQVRLRSLVRILKECPALLGANLAEKTNSGS